MSVENLNFDRVIERKNTDCVKYDSAAAHGMPEGILPMWVADMDFMVSQRILDAVEERVKHGIFGYTESGEGYFKAVAGWMEKRHGWKVEPEWLVKTPGVVFALAMAVKAYSETGEAVLIQEPVYYPFRKVIEQNKRRVISNDLVLGEDGRYHMDIEDLEKKIAENDIRLFLLCSPHNPVSRVWTAEELIQLGDICRKHHVIVVSDEIHADFVFGDRKHYVFANLKKEFEEISIVCTSPSKTFNIAGLQVSNIFIANGELRSRFISRINASGCSGPNVLGLTACEAAYRHGGEWYEAMMKYISGNIEFMREYIRTELPGLKMTETEGTYLVWADFRGFGLSEKELEELIVNKAHLWLDRGAMFGRAGAGFERFNVACSRSVLKQALEQLKEAVDKRFPVCGRT